MRCLLASLLAVSLLAAACGNGGSSSSNGTGGAGGATTSSNGTGMGDAGSVACGMTTCTGNDVCVSDLLEGGAIMSPDDAGACPSGFENQNGMCERLPTYHCAAAPAACGSGLTCACAQPLCDSGYTCQQASAGLVSCVLMAP